MRDNRLLNFEALRIVCMLMILTLHFLGKGQVLSNTDKTSLTYVIAMGLEFLSLVAVNCFVLITGFFGHKSSVSWCEIKQKIIRLWGWTWFYSVTIYIALILFRLHDFFWKDLFYVLCPFLSKQYWFITTYIVLFCLSPYINKFISIITVKEHTFLLIFLFVIFSVWPSVFPFSDSLDNSQGYSIIWFICMYLVGAYIGRNNGKIKGEKWILLYLCCSIISLIGWLGYQKIYRIIGVGSCFGATFMGYNSVLIVLSAITLFLHFKDLRVDVWNEKVKSIIRFLAPNVIGVYLIHEQKYLREILWTTIIPVDKIRRNGGDLIFYIKYVVVIVVVFMTCILVDKICKQIIKCIKKLIDGLVKKV